jgi:NTP pyrophosphatase (non-canonical NTP hydrolase)
MSDIKDLIKKVRLFAEERHWGPYHKPKDLSLKLMEEVGELVEHFQWKTDQKIEQYLADEDNERAVAKEIADCLIILLTMTDYCLDVDLEEIFDQKIEKNAQKYPVDQGTDEELL